MSDGSDLDLKSNLKTQKNIKPPSSPTEGLLSNQKKLTTKAMLDEALTNLKKRKGVSLYAIKKYMALTYDVDTDKMAYLIKKQINAGVEDGTIIRVRGIGVAGSFNLVALKKNPEKTKKKEVKRTEKSDDKTIKLAKNGEKPKPKKIKSKTKPTEKAEKEPNTSKSKEKAVKVVQKKIKSLSKKDGESSKMIKNDEMKAGEMEKKKNKMAPTKKTPAKKRAALMKRKSIGSIIKTPKMKPRA